MKLRVTYDLTLDPKATTLTEDTLLAVLKSNLKDLKMCDLIVITASGVDMGIRDGVLVDLVQIKS